MEPPSSPRHAYFLAHPITGIKAELLVHSTHFTLGGLTGGKPQAGKVKTPLAIHGEHAQTQPSRQTVAS